MKRLPLLIGLLAVVALSSSLAYWGMQFFRPPQRPLAAVAPQAVQAPPAESAATLFGGQPVAAVSSNYQLKGVVAANRPADGIAIISVDGKPPVAFKVGKEVAPGVKVQDVQARYALLVDAAGIKRLDLPADNKANASLAAPVGAPATQATPMAPPPTPQLPSMPPPSNVQPTPSMMMPPPQSGTGTNSAPPSATNNR